MRMIVPPDLTGLTAHLIGSPFQPKGDQPTGWDCRGLGRWCLATYCGVATPDYQALYGADIVSPRGAGERARLLAAGLADWREVDPQPGVIVWLEWLGRPGHVGFMLTPRLVLHADTRCGTALLDLDDPASGYRMKSCFVPAFVTEIQQL